MYWSRCVDELRAVSDLFIYSTRQSAVCTVIMRYPGIVHTVPDGKILIFLINIIRLSDITNH